MSTQPGHLGAVTKAAAPAAAGAMLLLLSLACQPAAPPETIASEAVSDVSTTASAVPRAVEPDPQERHLRDLRMLTDGGENAEAYFSFDSARLIFQSTRPPYSCDQIFTVGTDGEGLRRVSTGTGRTTCAYYYPDGQHILYASTHGAGPECPPTPDHSKGYVWPLYQGYDVYRAAADGSDVVNLTASPGYDAEATISPVGDRIVFTSMRDGDLDLYSMNLDGSDVVRLTDELGYDGGAFYSSDGSTIVYRARHPEDPEEIADYTALLEQDLIRPSRLEIFVMDADGGNKHQVTSLNAASFAPFFHPSGSKIIFSSNYGDPAGREFELYMVGIDGSGLERITFSDGFDGFPMWAPDGKTFVFCSNRHNSAPHETNVFVARWVD